MAGWDTDQKKREIHICLLTKPVTDSKVYSLKFNIEISII